MLLALALLAVVVGSVGAAPRYTITGLGILPDKISTSVYGNHSINKKGDVVGHCNNGGVSDNLFGDFYSGNVAFLWSKQDGIQALPLLPGKAYASAFTLNDRGQILGLAGNSWQDAYAVLWEKGTIRDLGALPGDTTSFLQGINNRGQIVGNSSLFAGDVIVHEYPVLLEKGQRVALPMGSLVSGQAYNINGTEQIIGQLRPYPTAWFDGSQPVLWDKGNLIFHPTLGGNWAAPWAINNRGQIAGYAGAPDGTSHAVLWEDGFIIDMGSLGGTWASLWAINSRGDAAGDSYIADDTADHAILVQDGVMYDLNDLIPPDSGWILLAADGINERGEISGTGLLNGEVRGFKLTPACGPVK
ncbi:MAG: hypothetical protein IT210_06605 [Armatimonadetes bacterium]|nr:hypothetical protein [Armatimonadota bacterium]